MIWPILKESLLEWRKDNVPRLAAALSFYAIFSLTPATVFLLAVASAVIGESTARAEAQTFLGNLMGEDRARFLLSVTGGLGGESFAGLRSLFWLGMLLFATTVLFSELRSVLNSIWQVEIRRGLRGFLYTRVLAFGTVLALIFLFLLSVAVNTTLTILRQFFIDYLPDRPVFLPFAAFVITLVVMACWFAMMFKFLPETRVAWGDVWVGAILASILFAVGSYVIGLYLGFTSVGSFYGAAGSLVMVLLWLYYSLQTILLGAEFTKVYARRFGSRAKLENSVGRGSSDGLGD